MMDIAPQGWVAIGVTTGLMALAIVAVALRFLARKKRQMQYGIDDWVTLLALVGGWYLCKKDRRCIV